VSYYFYYLKCPWWWWSSSSPSSCRQGETTSLNCAIPRVICEHGEPWWNDIDRGNSWFVHQSSLVIPPAKSSSSKAGLSGEGNEFCLTKNLFHTAMISLKYRKILRHGADGFTSPPKEGCCWFLLPLKIRRSRPGLNLRNLGSMFKYPFNGLATGRCMWQERDNNVITLSKIYIIWHLFKLGKETNTKGAMTTVRLLTLEKILPMRLDLKDFGPT
jgi:hypothetical protein